MPQVYDFAAAAWSLGPPPPRQPAGDVTCVADGGFVRARPAQGFEIPEREVADHPDAPELDLDLRLDFEVATSKWAVKRDPSAAPPPHMRTEGAVVTANGAFVVYGAVWAEARDGRLPPYESVYRPGRSARDYRAFAEKDGAWTEQRLPGGWPGRHVFSVRLG